MSHLVILFTYCSEERFEANNKSYFIMNAHFKLANNICFLIGNPGVGVRNVV